MSNDAASVLSVARGEIGYSRYSDPEAGTKYGRWFAQQTGEAWYGSTGVPYCAMFVSWVFAHAGATCAGIPSAYCPYVRRDAESAGAIVDKASAQPGDVILFDWGGDGVCDHVGIVERNRGSYVQTIEGNVSGAVARRTRSCGVVNAIVRPSYGSGAAASGGSGSGSQASYGGLVLDGHAGRLTVAEWARQLGLSGSDADGYISHQYPGNRQYLQRMESVIYNYTGAPSPTALAIQRKVGSAHLDGILGRVDVQNVQRWLNTNFGYHMVVDGYFGPKTAYNVQHSLNKGFWR